MTRGRTHRRTDSPCTPPPRFRVPLTMMPYWELARSQSQTATSSMPPLISLPTQMPWPKTLRQSNTRTRRVGRPMAVPSGFLPDLTATASSWVQKTEANRTQSSLESGVPAVAVPDALRAEGAVIGDDVPAVDHVDVPAGAVGQGQPGDADVPAVGQVHQPAPHPAGEGVLVFTAPDQVLHRGQLRLHPLLFPSAG